MNPNQGLYHELLDRLARLRRRRESVALGVGLASGLTAIVVICVAAMLAEMLGHFSIPVRTWLFWTSLTLCIAALGIFVGPALLVRLGIRKRATDDELAIAVGKHYSNINDRLVNTLQLARPLFSETVYHFGSAQFALAAFSNTYSSVRDVDFNAIVDDQPLKRAGVLFLFSLAVGIALFVGANSEMFAATTRLTHYNTFYQKPAPFTFFVFPGDRRVMRGDSLQVIVATTGEQLPQIQLRTREEGQKEFDAVKLNATSLDTAWTKTHGFKRGFIYSIHAQHPTEYFAEARDIESQRYKISVLDHPIVRSLNVTVQPPPYTRQKATTLSENIGDIAGVTGTRGVFRIVASTALAKANIVFTSLDTNDKAHGTHVAYPLALQDSIATGSITFLHTGSYHIDLLDRDSVASEHPIEYSVTITKDAPPEIALIEPSGRADLPSDMRLDMLARIHDDFGFRGVRLGYRISKSKYLKTDSNYTWLPVPLENYNTQELDVPYIWNLTPLGIGPEDEVSYVMEVTDNDVVTGPKSARTPEYQIRVPSVEEIFKRADEQSNKAQKDLNEVKQDAAELQKKVDEALSEMQQMKSSDLAKSAQEFSKQKDVQQMLDRQQQLNDRIDQISKDLKQMTQSMDQQNVLSPETMQKYQELQNLFKEINSPELKKAMEDLQRAMEKNVDPKKLQEAMKNMKLNEDQFRKSIERTANILKKIQAEQKIDELMKSADQLAKQEQKSADDTRDKLNQGKPMTPEEKAAEARKQEDAQKELDRMREEMKDVAKQMKNLPENMQAPEETKQAAEALADPSIDQALEEAHREIQKGDPQSGQKASEKSEFASKKMQNAERKLSDLKRKLSENERQRAMREMKQIREELNRLSKSEEAIKNKAHEAAPNSNVFRDLAEQQSQKKDELGQTASKAMQMAQKSTEITPEMGREMGKAFADMQKAEDAMTDRNQPGSEQNAQSAMSSLNKASQAFQKALQQMAQNAQQGSSGQGGEGQDGSDGEGSPGETGQSPGSSGSGGSAMQQFINQINKLAEQQMQLNNQMQAMANGQGGGANAQKELMRQQAMLNKLAAQQQAVKKSIEQMAEEQRQSQGSVHQAADDLRKIADEMQQTIGDMRSSGVRPETIQRQERILSRLLQAERSVHERDKDEERESKPGEDVVRQSPPALDIQSPEAQKELQQEILHSRETGYTPDYNALIRKYFESLEKK